MNKAWALLLGSLLLAGCAEDDREASFTYIQSAILRPQCSTIGCHSTRTEAFGVRFDDFEASYFGLTGLECNSSETPSRSVNTTDPDSSTLIKRLRGEGFNLQMPPDRPMPQADIDLIARWMAEGAQCN